MKSAGEIKVIKGMLRLLSSIYGAVIALRNYLYDAGILPIRSLPCPVISVGNVSVGGTGKTPMTIALSRWLLKAGWNPIVLTRGYGRAGRAPVLFKSDAFPFPVEKMYQMCGDEPVLMAQALPQVWVGVDAHRFSMGRKAVQKVKKPIALLDDGFQHRALHRDLDILLIDASQPLREHQLLPLGRLREPLASLHRAGALVLSRANESPDGGRSLQESLSRKFGELPIFRAQHVPGDILHYGAREKKSLSEVRKLRLLAFSGIGNPASFEATLEQLGIHVGEHVLFKDHHPYSKNDLLDLLWVAKQHKCEAMITTEKDAVRLQHIAEATTLFTEIYVLSVGIKFVDQEAFDAWFSRIVAQWAC